MVSCSTASANWFKFHLQELKIGHLESKWKKKKMCGVLQGSILGPLLFNMHMLPLAQTLEYDNGSSHNYTDDWKLYISFSVNDPSPLFLLSKCINEINDCMCQNLLQPNPHKTEVIVPLTPSWTLTPTLGQKQNQLTNIRKILKWFLTDPVHLEKLVICFQTAGLICGIDRLHVKESTSKSSLTLYKTRNGLGPKCISDLLVHYETFRPVESSGRGLITNSQGEAAFTWTFQ